MIADGAPEYGVGCAVWRELKLVPRGSCCGFKAPSLRFMEATPNRQRNGFLCLCGTGEKRRENRDDHRQQSHKIPNRSFCEETERRYRCS